MARKSNQGRSTKGTREVSKLSAIDLRKLNGRRYKKVMRDIYKSPIALYLASGVGTLLLARFMFRYYKNHPEIAEFVRENFETVEAKLREFRGEEISDDEMARH